MNSIETPHLRDLADLPATVGLVDAGRFYGLGREASYELARRGEFPVPVLALGGRLRVTKASLCHALGVDLAALEGASL